MCDNSDKCCKTVIAAVLSVKRSAQQMCDNVSVFQLLSLKRCASKRRHCADVSVVTVFIHRYRLFIVSPLGENQHRLWLYATAQNGGSVPLAT